MLIVVRMIWPNLEIDQTTLWLLAIAAIAIILSVLPITKIKIGDFEAEFDRALNALEKQIVESESTAEPAKHARVEVKKSTTTWRQEFFHEYRAILNSASSNFEKVVSAAILIEKLLLSVAAVFELSSERALRGPSVIVRTLVSQELITQEEASAFKTCWDIRNRVVHGEYGELSDAQTARALDLGWRLVKAFW